MAIDRRKRPPFTTSSYFPRFSGVGLLCRTTRSKVPPLMVTLPPFSPLMACSRREKMRSFSVGTGHLRLHLAAVENCRAGDADGTFLVPIIAGGTQNFDYAALHDQCTFINIDELIKEFLIKLTDQGTAPHAVADGQPGIRVADTDQISLPDLRIVFNIRIDGVSVQIQHLIHRHRHKNDVVLMQTGVSVEVFCFNIRDNLHH